MVEHGNQFPSASAFMISAQYAQRMMPGVSISLISGISTPPTPPSFFKSRVLYAVLLVLPLPAALSFNSVRTLRANSIGRNGFSR